MSSWWQKEKQVASSLSTDFSRPCPKNGCYDVFLSFRGTDTRYGFTSNLYRLLRENNVHTFMDIKLMGEDIEYLFEMIGISRMAVVIYSENFASSDWCMRELEMILQRRKEKKILIIPIFYKVDVHELKHMTGKTAEYLDKHIAEHGKTTVEKWKDVITSFSKVSGLSYKDNHGRFEYDFIMDVIARIKEKLEEYEEILESGSFKPYFKGIGTQVNIVERPIIEVQGYFRGVGTVTCIDSHITKPWFLLTSYSSRLSIWNYETRIEEKSFKVCDFSTVRSAMFVPREHWIVVGAIDGFLRVFDYNTLEKLKEFKPHTDNQITCVAVHPISPYVVTTSNDNLINLWNWKKDWVCEKTFKGHKHHVMQIAFNPKNPNSFASASWDGTIKIWNFDSSVAKYTINLHDGQTCLEYFVGNDDKLYLLSGSFDCFVRVLDYESKTLVQSLEGHSSNVTTTLFHPKLPFIITGSEDKTIRVWNKYTHRLELVWKSDLGRVWSIKFIKDSHEIALACDTGIVVIKIVNAETRLA